MQTTKATIGDKEYLMCFSTRVTIECYKRYGGIEKALQRAFPAKGKEADMETVFWLMHEMLKAGEAYAKLNGIDNPTVMPYDDFIDSIGIDDYPSLLISASTAAVAGTKRNVQTEPAKNLKTTQRK